MRLVRIEDTWINPRAVAFVQPDPPFTIEGATLHPGRPGWILIGLVGGQKISAEMDINQAVDLVNNWLAE